MEHLHALTHKGSADIYIFIYISVHKVWGTRVASWDVSRATAFIFVTLRAK